MTALVFLGANGMMAGKSTVANLLIREFGYELVKMAGPLKNMLRSLLRDIGYVDSMIERMVEGDLKEAVIPELGVTPRHLMQTLGTEWGRKQIKDTLWPEVADLKLARTERPVVDDIRYRNEAERMRSRGGLGIYIHREGAVTNGHSSEGELGPEDFDYVVYNDGTVADLEEIVRSVVR